MPIYEFYCPDCHTIFSFYSARINTEKRPLCPGCGRVKLSRRMSVFAVLRGGESEAAEPDVDEAALEKAMSALAGNEAALEGNDPRAAARAMREFYRAGGFELGPGTEEYLRRLEAGEDVEAVDAELGHILEEEDPLAPRPAGRPGPRPPARDEKLYEL